MSEPTLYNALKDIADAIRAKGITGTMSALEMPTKIAAIQTGGGSKYGISLDGLIGDVDGDGVLQEPSDTYTFTSTDIVEVPDGVLRSFFRFSEGLTAISLANLTTIGDNGMEEAFYGCENLESISFPSLTTVGDYGLAKAFESAGIEGAVDFSSITSLGIHGLERAFARCGLITSMDLSGLTTIPAYGLNEAFEDCIGMTTVDVSNITSIGDYGMKRAFIESGISSLSMPDLTTVGDNGLESAFFNCDSLTTLDLSGVTSIGTNGIKKMCTGCALLATVDMSSIGTLNGLEYLEAFDQCPSLQEVDISGIQTIDFLDATSVPTLNSTLLFDTTNNDYQIVVPDALYATWIATSQWNDQDILPHIIKASDFFQPLTFVARQANSTVAMAASSGSAPSVSLEYSTDRDTWSDFIVGTTTVTLANVGDKVYIRAGSGGNSGISSTSGRNTFVLTGSLDVKGNIMSLLDQTMESTTLSEDNTFYLLFYSQTAIVDASELELPATTLTSQCYYGMFYGCSNLWHVPELHLFDNAS